MVEKIVRTPIDDRTVESLKAGDIVKISGKVLTGRDAAHKKMIDLIDSGKELPFDIKGQIIYYVGPTPAKPGMVIGSAGPTTSSRMDSYAPKLIERGLKGMIGKGYRSGDVVEAMKKYKAVYFGAVGGAGALLSKTIVGSEILAWEELGTEAVRILDVRDLPATVIIDCNGNDLYAMGRAKYEKPQK
ncbi:MAG: Fe-S-containing hydro-lyase [Acidobacteriota bacterium]